MNDNAPKVKLTDLWHSLGDQRNDKWSVARLIDLSKDLPVFDAPVAALCTDYTLASDPNDLCDFAAHMQKVLDADLDYPIILGPNGVIVDGRHRLTKALLNGERYIKAVRFDEMPPVDGEEKDK